MPGYDIVSLEDALDIAAEQDMNLVTMNDAEIPVCRIMDYSKFLYNKQKQIKKNLKGRTELKEVRFNPVIADNDLRVKAKTASRILSEGDKVKITITYKGRMNQNIRGGLAKLDEFESLVEYPHNVDSRPKIEGNKVHMMISPIK